MLSWCCELIIIMFSTAAWAIRPWTGPLNFTPPTQLVSLYFTGTILIRRNSYTAILKFNLIKCTVMVRLGLELWIMIRVYCWCILRDFFLLLLCSPVVLEWIAAVNYTIVPYSIGLCNVCTGILGYLSSHVSSYIERYLTSRNHCPQTWRHGGVSGNDWSHLGVNVR